MQKKPHGDACGHCYLPLKRGDDGEDLNQRRQKRSMNGMRSQSREVFQMAWVNTCRSSEEIVPQVARSRSRT